jgi:hypothetical protein
VLRFAIEQGINSQCNPPEDKSVVKKTLMHTTVKIWNLLDNSWEFGLRIMTVYVLYHLWNIKVWLMKHYAKLIAICL